MQLALPRSGSLINVKGQVQSVVAKATFLGRKLSNFTDTSISAFLLSPLLVKKGLLFFSSLRAKEASHLKKQLSLLLQPLRGGRHSLNLSISQSLKVNTFKTFASPPPSPSSPPHLSSLIAH